MYDNTDIYRFNITRAHTQTKIYLRLARTIHKFLNFLFAHSLSLLKNKTYNFYGKFKFLSRFKIE